MVKAKKTTTPIVGKSKLVERVYNSIGKKYSLNKNNVEMMVNGLLEEVKKALVCGEEIRLPSYFSMKTTISKPRVAMNLQTKKKMTIPAKRVPKVKFSNDLKEEIAKKK